MSENIKRIYYPSAETPMTNDEIALELAQLAKKDRLWQALMQTLQERLAMATVDSTEVELTERSAGHAAGRLFEITQIQERLDQMRRVGLGVKAGRAAKPGAPR